MSRFFRPTLLLALLAAGRADASSILVLDARNGAPGPSVDAVEAKQNTPAPSEIAPGGAVPISSSIVAIGQPAVAGELTSAVEGKPQRGASPLVIRGGIFGEAFQPARAQAAAGQEPADPAAEPPAPSRVSRPQ